MPEADGLFFDHVAKSFGGTQALRGVSLHVDRGVFVALPGENGAGKSTQIKILGGLHAADSGNVLIDGAPYTHKPGATGDGHKVAFIHRDLGSSNGGVLRRILLSPSGIQPGEDCSGYVTVPAVVNKDSAMAMGDSSIFDPDNGYREAYAKIWGK